MCRVITTSTLTTLEYSFRPHSVILSYAYVVERPGDHKLHGYKIGL